MIIGYSPDAWKLGTRNQAFVIILSYMTDGISTTNRRGQIIMVNDGGQTNVNPDGAPIPVFWICFRLEDDMMKLITEVPELYRFPGWKREYLSLRGALCLRRGVRFLSRSGSCLARYNQSRTRKSPGTSTVSAAELHELRTPLTSVKSYLEALDDGALWKPVASDFVQSFIMKPIAWCAWSRSIELVTNR